MEIEKGKITGVQLVFMLTGFIQGSALLISFISGMSDHDTWLVVLAGMAVTMPFILSYAALARRFPGMNLVQINDIVYGRFAGKAVSIYFCFFLLMTLSFNVRDLGNFYTTFLMPDAPLIFFLAAFTLTCVYAVRKGIEVIARVSHLFVIAAYAVVVSSLLLMVSKMDFSNFLPILELKPVKFIQSTHIISAIPFGEVVIFLMIFSTAAETRRIVRNVFTGVLLGGTMLLLIAVRDAAVLGSAQSILTSPAFHSFRLIDIGNVFTRMDILVGVAQTMVMFLKCILFLYALATAVSQLFGLDSYSSLLLPIAGVVVIIAATVYHSQVEHSMITINTSVIYLIPLLYVFPPLSLVIAKIRGLPKKGKEGKRC